MASSSQSFDDENDGERLVGTLVGAFVGGLDPGGVGGELGCTGLKVAEGGRKCCGGRKCFRGSKHKR